MKTLVLVSSHDLMRRHVAVLPYLSNELKMLLSLSRLCEVSELEAKCLKGVAEIELNGFLFDKKAWESVRADIENETSKDGAQLREDLGWTTEENKDKNINSPGQVN